MQVCEAFWYGGSEEHPLWVDWVQIPALGLSFPACKLGMLTCSWPELIKYWPSSLLTGLVDSLQGAARGLHLAAHLARFLPWFPLSSSFPPAALGKAQGLSRALLAGASACVYRPHPGPQP